jgi:hypothetical protein
MFKCRSYCARSFRFRRSAGEQNTMLSGADARCAPQGHRYALRYAELYRKRYAEALQYFGASTRRYENAQTFYTGAGECTPGLGRGRLGCTLAIFRAVALR